MGVLFKDVLQFLFERAKAKQPGMTIGQYALFHALPRETMTRMLNGVHIPAAKTIWKILEKEGYTLDTIIDLPEMRAEREAQLARAESVLESNGDEAVFLRRYLEFLSWKNGKEKTTAVVATKANPPPQASRKRRRTVA